MKWMLVALLCGLASSAIAKNLRWNCVYSAYASPKGMAKQEFKLEFIADDITGKAVMVGNAGMADVDLHSGSYGVTFMEKLGSGVVQVTTIANDGDSVHSRHTIGPDRKLFPSQTYGQCRLVQ
jgi:hypothetical protein